MVKWHYMATKILVKIGSGNGLLPDGAKPLPEPRMANCQQDAYEPKAVHLHRMLTMEVINALKTWYF